MAVLVWHASALPSLPKFATYFPLSTELPPSLPQFPHKPVDLQAPVSGIVSLNLARGSSQVTASGYWKRGGARELKLEVFEP